MIGFVGLSHLGLVYSLASAASGFEVVAYEPDPDRARQLAEGRFPIEEPGLRELFAEHRSRLHYTADVSRLAECDLVFVSLDVPTDEDDQSDLAPLRTLVDSIRPRLVRGCSLVILSQVRPGFTRTLAGSVGAAASPDDIECLLPGRDARVRQPLWSGHSTLSGTSSAALGRTSRCRLHTARGSPRSAAQCS